MGDAEELEHGIGVDVVEVDCVPRPEVDRAVDLRDHEGGARGEQVDADEISADGGRSLEGEASRERRWGHGLAHPAE